MTVYSGVLGRNQSIPKSITKTSNRAAAGDARNASIGRLNIFLLFAVMLAVLAYIIFSNFLVSQRYLLNSLRSNFNQENIELAGSENGGSDIDLGAIINFARNTGMVEAKDTAIIFGDQRFALEEAGR